VYEKHRDFKTFTEEMTKLRQEAKLNKDRVELEMNL
jgi:hypothetical protein